MRDMADPFRGPKAATAPATVSDARPSSATGANREGEGSRQEPALRVRRPAVRETRTTVGGTVGELR